MISQTALEPLLPGFLARQPWFARGKAASFVSNAQSAPIDAVIRTWEFWQEGQSGLVWMIVDATLAGTDVGSYQVLIGLRPVAASPGFLIGATARVLGTVDSPEHGELVAYDALIDPELTARALGVMFPDLAAIASVRKLTVGKTSTSVVADEQWLCKVFRRVYDTNNPGVEMPSGLWANGFRATLETVEAWQRDGVDLALRRPFLPGAANGFDLASASLRELFASGLDPRRSPGDFSAEAGRIGTMLANMHRASIAAFGQTSVTAQQLMDETVESVLALQIVGLDETLLATWAHNMVARLDVEVPTMRVHGNLHLGQLLRSDQGWLVLDFEGAPLLAANRRRVPQLGWFDVGSMLRSFDYVAAMTSAVGAEVHPDSNEVNADARAWVQRNTQTFVSDYQRGMHIDDGDQTAALIVIGEVQRAAYEVAYERANRPDLVHIPTNALRRMLVSP